MTSTRPRLSVVMAVWNAEKHLAEAIDSVLGQTMGDFEFIIVDDNSSDSTADILAGYAARDVRVVILRNDENLGPYPSANRALEAAKAPLIARMDGDDICEPDRFEKQLAFLDANPDHLLVGCSYISIDEDGHEQFVRRNPMDWRVAGWFTRFRMPMVHPGFCFRAQLPDGTPVRYDTSLRYSRDYELAGRLAKAGKIALLPDILVRYRMHSSNISMSAPGEQDAFARAVAWSQVSQHYPEPLHADLAQFLDVSYRQQEPTVELVRPAVRGLKAALAHDFGSWHKAPAWAKRRTAGILSEAFLRGGGPRAAKLALHMALEAPEMIAPFAMRFLELRGVVEQRPAP
ncbi:glycosyltransferase [Qipengyuania sp. 1NDH17]|uniref:Glycosyltransferase n=1 Tax=Qipengyuania polymorpha TaxID=2867234 RepID=A0ABS7IXE9_9SPHN|nr:glycosyltransferase [Qipengyuania polymorpha]MBX7457694.1 glycosyltransferase [Qipengyuania polymorpha]